MGSSCETNKREEKKEKKSGSRLTERNANACPRPIRRAFILIVARCAALLNCLSDLKPLCMKYCATRRPLELCSALQPTRKHDLITISPGRPIDAVVMSRLTVSQIRWTGEREGRGRSAVRVDRAVEYCKRNTTKN